MKIFLLLLSLGFIVGCGKTWRTKPQRQMTPAPTPSASLDQWTGRSDYIDTGWQVKNQP